MNSITSLIEDFRAQSTSLANDFFPDLCDVLVLQQISDGHSGHTEQEASVATNIPCLYASAAPGSQIVVEGQTYGATHRVSFPYNSYTLGLTSKNVLLIHARGSEPAFRLEMPVRAKGSALAFVRVLARRTEGFREPGNV